MKQLYPFCTIVLLLISVFATAMHLHAAEAAKRSIETVMTDAMKGTTSLHRRVVNGQGTEADARKLLDYVSSLAAETPPAGDKASWDAKTSRLITATQALVDKKSNALTELQLASNCKACHSVHKKD